VKVVRTTIVPDTYSRSAVKAPDGRIDQWPASPSSSRAKALGESKRGEHHQSIEPSPLTRAADWQSLRSA
jgi:hypothetical protein